MNATPQNTGLQKSLEVLPETNDTLASKEAVKTDAIRGRTALSLANLKERAETRQFDTDTASRIQLLDILQKPETQKENLAALIDVSKILLALAIRTDPKQDFRNLHSIQQFFPRLNAVHPAEKKAVSKLIEITVNPTAPTSQYVISEWPTFVHDAALIANEMQSLQNADFQQNESYGSKTVEFVKNHPVMSLGIGIAGAVGMYKIFQKVSNWLSPAESTDEKKDDKKESGGLLKWVAGIGITIGALFGLGKALGTEGIKDFFKSAFNWKITDNRLVQALMLISKGKFEEARDAIWEGVDDNKDFHDSMAKHITKDMRSNIEVNGKTLFEIQKDSFTNCINGFGETQDQVSIWARKYGGDFVSYLGFDAQKKNEEQIVVRKFLQKHEQNIRKIMKKNGKSVDEETTIEDVLLALHQSTTPSSVATPQTKPAEGNDAAAQGNVDTVIETEPGKSGVGIDGTEATALAERYKDKKAFVTFLEEYKDNWGNAITKPGVFLDKLFAACKLSGIPVIITEGGIFLLDGDKKILFSSVAILYETAVALVAAPFSDSIGWSDAVGTYLNGAKTMIVIGAVGGGTLQHLKKWLGMSEKGFLTGMRKGIKAGLLFPVEIPRLHVAAGQRIYRTARGAEFTVRRLISAAELGPQILEEQARFHAQIAQSYDRLIGAADASLHRKNWWGWYTKDRAIELRQEHLKKFRLVFNDLQKKRGSLGLKATPEISTAMLDGDSRMDKINEFLAEDPSMKLASKIDVKGKLFKNPDGSFRKITDIQADVTKLKSEIANPSIESSLKALKERELAALEAYIAPAKGGTFEIKSTDFDTLDDIARGEKVYKLAAELEATEKGVQARFNTEVEKIIADAKVKKLPLSSPAITARLEHLDATLTIPFANQKQKSIKNLIDAYEKIPTNKRTPMIRAQLKYAIDGVDGTVTTRFTKGIKGRGKMMVLMASLMFATDQIIHQNEAERDFDDIMQELGPDMKQMLLDVSPFAGTYSNFHSAWTGREIISERDVSKTWDRTSNVIWGGVGLIGDVVTIVTAIPSGGGSLAANVVLRLTKASKGGSKVAAKLLKMWPRIEKIADRMGGFYEFAKKAKNYVGAKPNLLKGMRKMQTTGMIAGTAMLGGGLAYNLYYGYADADTEIKLPTDLLAEEDSSDNTPIVPPQTAPAIAHEQPPEDEPMQAAA